MYDLNEQEKIEATKYIVGTWEVDYIINAFSNDLAHIPVSEFKSEDGTDFSVLKFEFKQDGKMKIFDGNNEMAGTWEPTGTFEYKYHVEQIESLPDSFFKDNAEKLSVFNGALCFAIGFLSICMKKIDEGDYEEPAKTDDVAEAADEGGDEIVGRYSIYKVMSYVDDKFDFFTKEAVSENFDKQIAAGEADEDEKQESLSMFDSIVEFTEDRRVITWFKLPEEANEDEIKEAVEAGEIFDYRDGYAVIEPIKQWKYAGGKYYFNSEQEGTAFDEELSPWEELKINEDGFIIFGEGLMMLKKI